MRDIALYLNVFVWSISLNIMISRCIHFPINVSLHFRMYSSALEILSWFPDFLHMSQNMFILIHIFSDFCTLLKSLENYKIRFDLSLSVQSRCAAQYSGLVLSFHDQYIYILGETLEKCQLYNFDLHYFPLLYHDKVR